jgi:zinc protease
MFGLPGLAASDPDYPALRVLNHILGSGDFDSLLMSEIRVKRGLAYSADTRLQNDLGNPLLIGRFSTRNGSMKEALSVVRGVLTTTAAEGPAPEHFENARGYVAGSSLLDTDTSAKLAGALLETWRAGEGIDALSLRGERARAVTLDDVRRVARRVLVSDRMLVSIVGAAE